MLTGSWPTVALGKVLYRISNPMALCDAHTVGNTCLQLTLHTRWRYSQATQD